MQTWKTRFRRIAAMVCALALCASLLPAGALAEPENTPEQASSSSVASEPEKQPADEGVSTQNVEPTQTVSARSNEVLYADETNGITVQMGEKIFDPTNPQKVTFIVKVEDEVKSTITLDNVYSTAAPLEISADGWNCNVYGDGVTVTDNVGGKLMTFIGKDEYTVNIEFTRPVKQIELRNTDGSIDLGTATYKTGGNQTTTFKIYLNYMEVCTIENASFLSRNAIDYGNFVYEGDYYLRYAEVLDSDLTAQTVVYYDSSDSLWFSNYAPAGHNTIALYFFNYTNGTNVDFSRWINDTIYSEPLFDGACDTLNISYNYGGVQTSYNYTNWGRIYLPNDTDITVVPTIGDGYYFEYWRDFDAGSENRLYSILSDREWVLEGQGTAHAGYLALTETLGMRFTDTDYPDMNICLYMTDGERDIVHHTVTYNSNYPADTGLTDESYEQHFYSTEGAQYGTRILDDMFKPEGYELICWTTQENGEGQKFMPDDLYGNEGSGDLTLYAQWKKIDEPSEDPHEPTDEELDGLLKNAIKIVCIDNTSHEELLSDLLDQGKPENESYKVDYTEGAITATVTINRTESYVNAYETAYPGYGEHLYKIEEGVTDVTIKLKWENGAWALDETIPAATITLSCDTTSSTTPSEPEISTLNSLLDVEVTCQNNSNHSKKFVELLDGSYVISTPTMGTENYECTVTITADSYIKQMAGDHKIVDGKPDSKEVLLAYVNDQWTVANDKETTVSFLAECVAPEAPDNITVAGLLKDVTVTCDEHNSKTYDIDDTTITVDKSSLDYDGNNEAFIVEVSVAAKNYVDQYIGDFGPHTLNDTKSKTVALLYQNGSWGLANKDAKVEFKVKCDTPDKPEYDEIAGLLGDVTVTCDVHGTETYKLSDGNYEVGGIQGGGYGALVKVTVFGAAYVDKFEADHNNIAHKLVGSEQITISLVYQKDGWMIDSSDLGKTIAFQVTCKPDAPTTDEVDALKIKNAVTLDCINTSVNHADVTYDLKSGSYTIGEVVNGGNDLYYVSLTVRPDAYVCDYDKATGSTHTWPGNDYGIINLYWNNDTQAWETRGDYGVKFLVKCSTVTVPGDGGNNNDTPKDEHPDIAEGIANGTWGGTPTPTPAASATSTIPQTSDSMPIGLLAGTAAIAAAAIALLLVLRKRRQQ